MKALLALGILLIVLVSGCVAPNVDTSYKALHDSCDRTLRERNFELVRCRSEIKCTEQCKIAFINDNGDPGYLPNPITVKIEGNEATIWIEGETFIVPSSNNEFWFDLNRRCP